VTPRQTGGEDGVVSVSVSVCVGVCGALVAAVRDSRAAVADKEGNWEGSGVIVVTPHVAGLVQCPRNARAVRLCCRLSADFSSGLIVRQLCT
jgi:hypothetical protein